jgi:nickel transport protein
MVKASLNFRTIHNLVLRIHRSISFSKICLVGVALLPSITSAHELELTVTLAAPAAIVRAAYGGSEPVPFAKVEVFAPGADRQQFLLGTTDKRGYFSFVPESGGNWRVVVDDEEGHRREAAVTIPDPFQSNAQTVIQHPQRLERVLLGLSLIFGLTGFLYGFKARRRP